MLVDERLRATRAHLLQQDVERRLHDPRQVESRARAVRPQVDVEVVRGAGHGLVYQHPDRIAERILEFSASGRR